jgi:2-polyprenyl-3-methyl-5-hydroxy-6-metoxy-1,4-benzoquinol methylase
MMISESVEKGADPVHRQPRTGEHLCPWWMGYLLASPLRRLAEKPEKLLAPYVTEGMTVVDLGCAMGFHSIPMARLVGPSGRVVCVDIQERMLGVLRRRARRRGLDSVIETRACTQEDLGLEDMRGQADVALAFHVVHESHHPAKFFADCFATLRPRGRLILAEPSGRLSAEDRAAIFELAVSSGFVRRHDLTLRRSQCAVFEKPAAESGSGV